MKFIFPQLSGTMACPMLPMTFLNRNHFDSIDKLDQFTC